MNKRWQKRISALFLAIAMGLTGCTANVNATTATVATKTVVSPETAANQTAETSTASTGESVTLVEAESEDSDATYDASKAVTIQLTDSKVSVSGKGVKVSGQVVTITEPGTYVVSGTLKAGQLIVATDKEEKVHLILKGAHITSNSGPALWVQSAEKVILTLEKGTKNSLTDSANYTLADGEDEPDAALFSKEDLSINGMGTLTVSGKYSAGIKSKDTLLVMSGTLNVSAVKHALNGKDAVGIFGGTLTVASGEDGIHSSTQVLIKAGSLNIAAGDDGIHADAVLTIDGGKINVSKSNEGIESANITINGGDIKVKASDDGLNAAGGNDGSALGGQPIENSFSTSSAYFIKINGGKLQVNADGDGIDANGSIYMTGGTVLVSGPTNNGNGALDYDAAFEVSGGTLAIAGSSGMAQAPSATSKQNSILVYYTNTQAAGTKAILKDASGNVLFSYTPEKAYQSIVFSGPNLKQGQTYSLFSGNTLLTKITPSAVTTSISDKGVAVTGGMGGMGGHRPGDGGKPQNINGGTPPVNAGGTPPTPPTNGEVQSSSGN